jgi:hypothetical protein
MYDVDQSALILNAKVFASGTKININFYQKLTYVNYPGPPGPLVEDWKVRIMLDKHEKLSILLR